MIQTKLPKDIMERLEKLDCENFEKTIELNPSYSNAWISLGNLANARGDAQQQIICYKKAASLGHTQAQEWLQKNTTPQ
jgi:tetratricopeptide (TPR) repeat protein